VARRARRLTAVRAGSDAQRAGPRPGDEVLRIGGCRSPAPAQSELHCDEARASAGARRWALLTLLAGRRGMERTLEVRDVSDATRTLTLPRRTPLRSGRDARQRAAPRARGGVDPHQQLDGPAADRREFDAALAQVRDVPGLILDLRDIPSGGNLHR